MVVESQGHKSILGDHDKGVSERPNGPEEASHLGHSHGVIVREYLKSSAD